MFIRNKSGFAFCYGYTWLPVPETKLYFAYTSILEPERLAAAAPNAEFRFTAHYPETRLSFVANGPKPTVTLVHGEGSTVWGGVFEIPEDEIEALTAIEEQEGRVAIWEERAIDRGGNKHDCLTFVSPGSPGEETVPPVEYVETMIAGARHWDLPAGWVVGLQDLVEDPLFS